MKEYFDLSPFCKACCENYEVINSQEQKNNCVKQFARLFPISNKKYHNAAEKHDHLSSPFKILKAG